MKPTISPWPKGDGSPKDGLRWAHWQRLGARWFRLWVYALSGWFLGWGLMVLSTWPQSQDAVQVQEAVARLQRQLAALPARGLGENPSLELDVNPQQQAMLASLPSLAQQNTLWPAVQQVVSGQGLRLASLRPMPSDAVQSNRSGQDASPLPSQTVAMRLEGRWDDWVSAWAVFSLAGPVCSIDRLAVQATAVPGEVQIDLVLRFWMLPGGTSELGWLALVDAPQGDQSRADARPKARAPLWDGPVRPDKAFGVESASGVAPLFAAPKGAGDGAQAPSELQNTPSASAQAAQEDLPPDPRHWPLARVRWLGWWQQGPDRLAILAAGPHLVRVQKGQRVTREGHRVQAFSDTGLDLRLDKHATVRLSLSEQTPQAHLGKEHPLKEDKP
jgi:hypothetical protein